MEGPYRDLGSGFARLTGVEGARRGPSNIDSVEDVLFELLCNARDAGANSIYIASSLKARRYRTLVVLDDGHGIPDPYRDLIFEPGVTSRHLEFGTSSPGRNSRANGSGLSLYHIKNTAIEARVFSENSPTSLRVTLDTSQLPERSLQSDTRSSSTNLLGVTKHFLSNTTPAIRPKIYYGSPASILAILIKNHIIQNSLDRPGILASKGERVGLDVSVRTVQRILRGEVSALNSISTGGKSQVSGGDRAGDVFEGVTSYRSLELSREEMSRIAAILGEAARTRYLEIGDFKIESRPGEIVVRSRIYEPEEEYD